MYGKVITSNTIEVKMNGSMEWGINLTIKSKKTEELVLREQIQSTYSLEIF